jgi:hypothetical protein
LSPRALPGANMRHPVGVLEDRSPAPKGPSILAHGIAVASLGQSEQQDVQRYFDAYGRESCLDPSTANRPVTSALQLRDIGILIQGFGIC